MLRQHPEETGSTWQHTRPASPWSGPRFDKDTAAEILETAARLQSGEQETLTQAEIEGLAREMGIEPRHVQQAIALSGRQAVSRPRLTRIRLSRRQKQLVTFAPLLYGLYMVLIVHLTWRMPSDFIVYASLFVLPFVLSLWLGTQSRYKRVGALAGVWVIAALACGIFIGVRLHGIQETPTVSELVPLLWMVLGAAASGTLGAALRQWFVTRQLPFVPTAIRASDLDR